MNNEIAIPDTIHIINYTAMPTLILTLLEHCVTEFNLTHGTNIDYKQMNTWSPFFECEEEKEGWIEIFVAGEPVVKKKFDGIGYSIGAIDNIVSQTITEVLEEWYEKIIAQEKINKEKLFELEQQKEYEFLLEYYQTHDKEKYPFFLKKAASIYPHYYRFELLELYDGSCGKKYANAKMAKFLRLKRRGNKAPAYKN